jgi:oligopeptidase B
LRRQALHLSPFSFLNPSRSCVSAAAESMAAIPPVARKVPRELAEHGDVRVDDYYWLRDDARADPAVLAHLRAENDYAAALMSGQITSLLLSLPSLN